MSESLISGIVTVATAIVGVAILAVLVSSNAKTSEVLQAGSEGFAADLRAAVSPVTGGGGYSFNGLGGGGVPQYQ